MRRKRGNKWFWIIILLIAFPSLARTLGSIVFGLASGFMGLAIVGVAIYFIVKLLKKEGYMEPEKDERPSANPYSVKSEKGNKSMVIDEDVDTKRPEGGKVRVNTSGSQNKQKAEPKPAPEPPKKPVRQSTGDPELDKMVEDKDKAIAEMQHLNDVIEDPTLSDQIDHLQAVTDKIVTYVVAHPNKKKQVGKFFSYYLPTTLKLLNAYARMDEAGISGANIDSTKEKVEEMMGTALSAFDKQLDALFAEEALDVTTDISVMENMLKAEGLMDDDLMNEAKELVKTYQE